MKKIKFLALSALLLSTFTFQSCKDDDDESKPEEVVKVKHIFILNEGLQSANNSTLDCYYPNGENSYQSKVYNTTNGEGLGDTGQDIICYGKRVYVSVWGSNYIAKLDQYGKVLEKYSFKSDEGEPRYLAAKDGYVYVSTYAGKVAKFDTSTIAAPIAFAEVGNNPEGIAVAGNYLVVCNSQQNNVADNRLSIVDLSSFSLKKHIESEYGNFQQVTVVGNNVYVTYFTPAYATETLSVDIENGTIKPAVAASKIATDGTSLYCINTTSPDWVNYNTSYFKLGSTDSFLDLTSTPELSSAIVYMFEIDPQNGDFYIGTTDYATNGNVYRFDKTGKFITKFETSSISPNHAAFVY